MKQISETMAGDLIVTAVEGGFGHEWWDAKDYHWRDAPNGGVTARVALRERREDGSVGPWMTLDRGAVQRGLELLLENGRVSLASSYRGALALFVASDGQDGDVDAIAADAVVQAALLGDIIYG